MRVYSTISASEMRRWAAVFGPANLILRLQLPRGTLLLAHATEFAAAHHVSLIDSEEELRRVLILAYTSLMLRAGSAC